MSHKIYTSIVISLIVSTTSLFSACGFKGDLYLPQSPQAQLHSNANQHSLPAYKSQS